MTMIINYDRCISFLLYAVVGYTLYTTNFGVTTWQYWVVMASLIAEGVTSYINGMHRGQMQ